MRAKDKCPSCFQPVAPTDFLCANCELILDPSQAPERQVGVVSVVRRMLEMPQRGVPSSKPNPRPPRPSPTEGLEGPTRKLDLGPELSGVPVVVATLTGRSVQLSEFEAWVVSMIDGLSDASALAKKVGVRELELRVVLRTLNDKHIIDFADEPLSDADLEMPSVMGTLDEDAELVTAPGVLDAEAPAPPPPPAPSDPFPFPPAPPPMGRRAAAAAPYPAMTAEERAGLPPSRAVGSAARMVESPLPPVAPPPPAPRGPERTDPRIAYSGAVNRKVLDALKKVKRTDAHASPSAPREETAQPLADVLARDTLQVALRMEQGGRLDEAIRFLEKSIAQSPEAASLYNRLGIILIRERADYRRAETLIRKAVDLAPDNTVYSTNLRQVVSQQAMRSHRK